MKQDQCTDLVGGHWVEALSDIRRYTDFLGEPRRNPHLPYCKKSKPQRVSTITQAFRKKIKQTRTVPVKKIVLTNPLSVPPLLARVALGIVLFPHGAQKLLGWFGGGGFEETMTFFTKFAGLPWLVGFLVILIEFFGSLMLLVGAATRVAALGVLGTFIGVVLTSEAKSIFFMNWSGEAHRGEGLEYFILLLSLALIALIAGGGSASVDALLTKRNSLGRA